MLLDRHLRVLVLLSATTTTSRARGQGSTLYANLPYDAYSPAGLACTTGVFPKGDDADATINVASHEHREAITDPGGDAWYDSSGDESADKCAWTFGASLGTTGSGSYNQLINGHRRAPLPRSAAAEQ